MSVPPRRPPVIKEKVLAALKAYPRGLTVRDLASTVDHWEPSIGSAVYQLRKENMIKDSGRVKIHSPRKQGGVYRMKSTIWVLV